MKINRIGKKKKKLCLVALLVAVWGGLVCFSGCEGNLNIGTRVVFTMGFDKDEVFQIEGISCRLPELMVYLTTSQNQYESVYGEEIWKASVNGITLEQNIKDIALARIAQIKTMNLLAKEHGVELTEQEQETVAETAGVYYSSLNETEKELLGVTEAMITKLYAEYALADKIYQYIIKDINPEISDDEARTIRIQQILLKTYALDGTGKRIEYTEETKGDVYTLAQSILTKAREGEDFEELMETYGEDGYGTWSFGKGEKDPVLEEAAFQLGNGEMTLVETRDGYHIMKCISTLDRAETEANKVKIMEERKQEVFGEEYDVFVESLTRKQNMKLWEKVEFIRDERVKTSNFFEIYEEYFSLQKF